jgi:hypothetical protein
MFPPTPTELADVVHVDHPIGDTSPGAAWLLATAARAAGVQQQIVRGHDRDTLVTLHAHYAVEDPQFDPCKVAAEVRPQAVPGRFGVRAIGTIRRGLLARVIADHVLYAVR